MTDLQLGVVDPTDNRFFAADYAEREAFSPFVPGDQSIPWEQRASLSGIPQAIDVGASAIARVLGAATQYRLAENGLNQTATSAGQSGRTYAVPNGVRGAGGPAVAGTQVNPLFLALGALVVGYFVLKG